MLLPCFSKSNMVQTFEWFVLLILAVVQNFDMLPDLFWGGRISWILDGVSVNSALFCFRTWKFLVQGFQRGSMSVLWILPWVWSVFVGNFGISLKLDGEIVVSAWFWIAIRKPFERGLLAAKSSWIWVFKSLCYPFLVSLGFVWPLCFNGVTLFAYLFISLGSGDFF